MKKLLLLAIAVLALTSCEKEEMREGRRKRPKAEALVSESSSLTKRTPTINESTQTLLSVYEDEGDLIFRGIRQGAFPTSVTYYDQDRGKTLGVYSPDASEPEIVYFTITTDKDPIGIKYYPGVEYLELGVDVPRTVFFADDDVDQPKVFAFDFSQPSITLHRLEYEILNLEIIKTTPASKDGQYDLTLRDGWEARITDDPLKPLLWIRKSDRTLAYTLIYDDFDAQGIDPADYPHELSYGQFKGSVYKLLNNRPAIIEDITINVIMGQPATTNASTGKRDVTGAIVPQLNISVDGTNLFGSSSIYSSESISWAHESTVYFNGDLGYRILTSTDLEKPILGLTPVVLNSAGEVVVDNSRAKLNPVYEDCSPLLGGYDASVDAYSVSASGFRGSVVSSHNNVITRVRDVILNIG